MTVWANDDMSVRRTARAAAILVVAASCGVPSALAQSRGGFRPVFGGAASADANARAAVNLSATLAEAYDDDLLAEGGATPGTGLRETGMYTSLTPLVSLYTQGRTIGFSVTAHRVAYGAEPDRGDHTPPGAI